jgi:hypothetical protein
VQEHGIVGFMTGKTAKSFRWRQKSAGFIKY